MVHGMVVPGSGAGCNSQFRTTEEGTCGAGLLLDHSRMLQLGGDGTRLCYPPELRTV